LEKEIDEVQEELDTEREKRTKRKHKIPAQAAQPSARETDSDVKAELEELKVKCAAQELTIKEMSRMMREQQCLIVRLFKEVNSVKEKDGSYPAMSEQELNSLTDAAKYPLMQSGAGGESEKMAEEELFDDNMNRLLY